MSDVKYSSTDLQGVQTSQLQDWEKLFTKEVADTQKALSKAQSNLAKIRKELKNRKRNGR